MSRAMDEPQRSVADLSADERRQLEAGHARLRQAVQDYERFIARPLAPTDEAPEHRLDDMGEAQAQVQAAEADLWRLREELLGWRRPGWAPTSSSVSDWFSDEDGDYDEYPLTTSS